MMKRLAALLFVAAVAGCASPDDEPRLTKLSDGAYEWSIPQTFGNTTALAAVEFYNGPALRGKAGQLCPNGYQIHDHGFRKRPEYADADKVWRIECK
jgi:hypothetical protein